MATVSVTVLHEKVSAIADDPAAAAAGDVLPSDWNAEHAVTAGVTDIAIADVAGLQAALDGKSDDGHTHAGLGVFTFGPTPPVGASSPGDRWVNSEDGRLYTYVDDGTSGQWVEF